MATIGTIIVFVFVGIIFSIPVLMAISVYGGVMLGSRSPFWFVLPYFAFILAVPDATYGLSIGDVDVGSNYYSRGAGVLVLPFVNYFLMGYFATVMVGRYFNLTMKVSHDQGWIMRAFLLIIFANIIIGLFLGYSFVELIDHKGLRNFFFMILAFYLVIGLFRSEKDFHLFINLFISISVLRGIFGAVRYFFFGGDPANFYANFEKIDVKLTFFEINDSFMATVTCFIAAWRLLQLHGKEAFWLKAFYGFIVALEAFIVIFSFRRTSWIGFGLAAILFAVVQRKQLRNLLLIAYVSAGVPVLIAQTLKRMSRSTVLDGAGLLERVAPDVFSKSQYGPSSGRFVELAAAWDSIVQYPIFGLGIWGSYNGDGIFALRFHRGDFTWMHSGILHIALKTGFVGVGLLFLMWWRYGSFIRREYSQLSKEHRGLILAFAAGYVFFLPTWLIGTPVVEFRTMQIVGMTLGIPYVIAEVSRRSRVRG